MKGQIIVIAVDGTAMIGELDTTPALEQLQAGVGGNIEIVPYFIKYGNAPCVAFCNEEGKLEGLPVNTTAQRLWEDAYGDRITEDVLVGPIVIVTGDDELLNSL